MILPSFNSKTPISSMFMRGMPLKVMSLVNATVKKLPATSGSLHCLCHVCFF